MTARVVIAAGGTGGHVFPALAVANELRRLGAEVRWLGAGGIETQVVPPHGILLQTVPFRPPSGILGGLRLLIAVMRARKLLRQHKPSVVLGMGGYAAVPGALAGRLLGAPLIVHEQNAIAGRANRLLNKFARRTLTGFPDSLPKGEWVGNPVRDSFWHVTPPSPDTNSPLRLLILGGSQGAQALNSIIPQALTQVRRDCIITHQCGRGREKSVRDAYAATGIQAEVTEFIDDVATCMAAADLVICRAGAATLAEATAAGAALLLVPYPHAASNHQLANAQFFKKNGAAEVCEQIALTPAWLADFLQKRKNQH
jgi:UDP-N-acetylglucosamine--N-acetylmuramyl-(pentapeptide) pyrophosphoryl-undecaprenol N-acetylglucosamine transferase